MNTKTAEAFFVRAIADLWQRDINELRRTKQHGGNEVCVQLEAAIAEIRQNCGKPNAAYPLAIALLGIEA